MVRFRFMSQSQSVNFEFDGHSVIIHLLGFCFVRTLLAQSSGVQGTVVDESGAAVADVAVVAKNLANGATSSAKSGNQGFLNSSSEFRSLLGRSRPNSAHEDGTQVWRLNYHYRESGVIVYEFERSSFRVIRETDII